MQETVVVVGGVSDDPFAIDVAHFMGQHSEISDLISYKRFANSEFCPRFISDENDFGRIGSALTGKTVVIISTCCGEHTRNALAMRNFLVTRAAKDNGAEQVVLVEPDLSYSAQDRGPRAEHGETAFVRPPADFKKFDGQAFSSLLYAELLQTSGVDSVVTVHNHSISVQRLFARRFFRRFHNLRPAGLYAHYLAKHELVMPAGAREGLVICAPDNGAAPFAREVYDALRAETRNLLIRVNPSLLLMEKMRSGEREVTVRASPDSPTALEDARGRTVIVLDDMVRTGSTIAQCCRQLRQAGAERIVFVVTHFHSSAEVKENLSIPAIDEIITTNTLPNILNRDMQGRLRKKMLVLKIEKWIANALRQELYGEEHPTHIPPYSIDISSKNPRWQQIHGSKGG